MVSMAFYGATSVFFCALLLSLEFLAVASQSPTASPPASTPAESPIMAEPPSTITPAPAPEPATPQDPQVINMLEAVRDAGQFGAIAGLLDGLQMRNLTPMTTWLLPNDEAFSGATYPKNVTRFLDYHVISELLPYSRLATLSVGTRLPTFESNVSLVVTSNILSNYSLDNAMIVVPDLYSDTIIAVHGINAVLKVAIEVSVASPGEAPAGAPGTSPSSPSSSSSPSTSTNQTDPSTPPAAAPTMPTSMALSVTLILVVASWIM